MMNLCLFLLWKTYHPYLPVLSFSNKHSSTFESSTNKKGKNGKTLSLQIRVHDFLDTDDLKSLVFSLSNDHLTP